jgi:hypothetical protein
MNTTSLPRHTPQDLVHSINNQLALLSGHLSLLELSKSLNPEDQQTAAVMSRAVFAISEHVKLLGELATQHHAALSPPRD